MRLDKILANLGYGSRKEVKKLLRKGLVTVDGVIIRDGKQHVDPHKQQIIFSGEEVVYREFVYFMLNKPKGVISATVDDYDETVIDLLQFEDSVLNPFPVGRLDKDTEGLLILTNDGQLSHRLLSPRRDVPKTYYAVIEGEVNSEHIDLFKEGVTLDDGYLTKPAKLTILKTGLTSEIELTITEGKFHQVKRMFRAIDRRVIYLKRISMGPISLDEDLALGEYRELSAEEVELLQAT